MSLRRKSLESCMIMARESIHKHPQKDCFLHWTFVFQDAKVVEVGMNMNGAPPVSMGYASRLGSDNPLSPKLHSEFVAWKRAKGILNKDKNWGIVNIRLNRKGEIRNSAPCRCCYGFLDSVGCSFCYFTTTVGFSKIIY